MPPFAFFMGRRLGINSYSASNWRLYYNPSVNLSYQLPSKSPPVFPSCLHHLCHPLLKLKYDFTNTKLIVHKPAAIFSVYLHYPRSNFTSLLWYSSKPFYRAYRKRVNKRLRLASKPVLNEAQFNEAVSKLPARFTADDLHNIMVLEDDPVVCLELFNWASRQHRFKHSVTTFHITIQKLGIAGMLEEMYSVVEEVLALPHFGSEALFNTVIYYLTRARKLSRAITVFKHMKKVNNSDCKPSVRTYNLLFSGFLSRGRNTHINYLFMGTMEVLFRQMINDGLEPDIFSLNSMIQGYVLSNHVNDALRIFHQMGVVYTCSPNALTYDHLIFGLCAQSRTNNAQELFNQMKEKGLSANAKTYNSVVNALAFNGEVDKALRYFWEMSEKQRPVDFITYKTLLDEFCRGGRAAEALSLAKEFKEKQLVDEHTYRKLLHIFKDDFKLARMTHTS